jgi:hypothetical protein
MRSSIPTAIISRGLRMLMAKEKERNKAESIAFPSDHEISTVGYNAHRFFISELMSIILNG